jgi:ABC-type Fe3+/spermidine/putrescine transport system ATPase subunit
MASNDDAYISLSSIRKCFGSVRAVDDVSFDIRRGEFFSLLGPSGCGKTTLLRMLAGFEFPDHGEIFIDGQPVSAVPANGRPTNMVFQNYAIFPHLTVAENIAYGLRKKRLSKQQMTRTVDQALDLIKLSGYGGRAAHQLSGGQRQRVALARALVCRPKVLLLDEPLGALDKKLREEMQIELRQLQRSVGITFVFVTHDQEEALALSDRIAVMAKGRALQIDTAARLYEAPNCRQVAGFIGSMNFFDGSVKSLENAQAIIDAGAHGALQVAMANEASHEVLP